MTEDGSAGRGVGAGAALPQPSAGVHGELGPRSPPPAPASFPGPSIPTDSRLPGRLPVATCAASRPDPPPRAPTACPPPPCAPFRRVTCGPTRSAVAPPRARTVSALPGPGAGPGGETGARASPRGAGRSSRLCACSPLVLRPNHLLLGEDRRVTRPRPWCFEAASRRPLFWPLFGPRCCRDVGAGVAVGTRLETSLNTAPREVPFGVCRAAETGQLLPASLRRGPPGLERTSGFPWPVGAGADLDAASLCAKSCPGAERSPGSELCGWRDFDFNL